MSPVPSRRVKRSPPLPRALETTGGKHQSPWMSLLHYGSPPVISDVWPRLHSDPIAGRRQDSINLDWLSRGVIGRFPSYFYGGSAAPGCADKRALTALAALRRLHDGLPFKILGLDSESGSEFLNAPLLEYCADQRITFTRCRRIARTTVASSSKRTGLSCGVWLAMELPLPGANQPRRSAAAHASRSGRRGFIPVSAGSGSIVAAKFD